MKKLSQAAVFRMFQSRIDQYDGVEGLDKSGDFMKGTAVTWEESIDGNVMNAWAKFVAKANKGR